MLGIVLPVLTLVMLPLLTAFVQVPGIYILLLFDIVLPITVFALAKNALAMRPGGLSKMNPIIYNVERESRPKAFLSGFGVLALFIAPVVFLSVTAPGAFDFADPTIGLYLSLTVLAGIGFSISTYCWVDSKDAIKIKRGVEKVERYIFPVLD